MKRELYREFGDALDITTTQALHRRASARRATAIGRNRFEELYRSFLAYFRVRGFQPEEPKFPLVAIVYPQSRTTTIEPRPTSGNSLPTGMLGHYDHDTNRVQLFDVTAGNPNGDWSDNADTIIHEATHQTAFNVGIHNRFADQPRWLVEGLATMFEARGVWNSQSYHSLNDRINKGRLADFRAGLNRAQAGNARQSGRVRPDVQDRCGGRLRRGLGDDAVPVRDASAQNWPSTCRRPLRAPTSAATSPPSG